MMVKFQKFAFESGCIHDGADDEEKDNVIVACDVNLAVGSYTDCQCDVVGQLCAGMVYAVNHRWRW